MILLLVAENRSLKGQFSTYFGSMGYTVIQYTHPLKAMDNTDEIHPDVILCDALDYPRHWKLIVKQIRETRDRSDAVLILLVPEGYDSEEADKAAFLGVNILYSNRLETVEDFRELDNRISRYKTPPDRSQVFTWIPGDDERVSFIFHHPFDFRLISGRFTELSPAGGVFTPDDPGDIAGLETGTVLNEGSLRAGQSLLSLKSRIIRNSGTLMLAFMDFSSDGFRCLLEEMSGHFANTV